MSDSPKKPKDPKDKKKFGWNSPDHNPEEFRLSLVEHLEELRTRIIRCFLILIGFWILAWWRFDDLNNFLVSRTNAVVRANMPDGRVYKEVFHNAPDAFLLMFKISFYAALIFSFPFIVLQLWAFIAPGLKPEEQKPLKQIGPISLFLFFLGGFFCWLILPQAFTWFSSYLINFKSTDLYQEAGQMAMLSLKSILAFGIGFQLPLVVYILGALNLLSAETLIKYWRHAAVAIFFISGAITPSNDIPSMLMMAIPLTILFAISTYAVKLTQAKKKKKEEAERNPKEVVIKSEPTEYEAPKDLTSEESDSDDVNT